MRAVEAMVYLLGLMALPACVQTCTSIMAGPEATVDGSVWVGQSDDGEGAADSRLVWVPPMEWPAGSMRPVINYGNFPRYVGTERNISAYFPSKRFPNATTDLVIGHVPQLSRTFGFYEGNYAISNDQGVSFGESTVSAKTFSTPKPDGPSLFSMNELSRVAAERAATARAAVLTMGHMAEKYGFYGDPSADTGGESILIADADEQFIFHIMAESESKGGAIWAAQRMPRDHVTIVSNAWILGYINATDGDNFLFSSNMHSVAKANGWWDGNGLLHWSRTFSGGEYTSKYYAGRRMWGFWKNVAPTANIPPEYDTYLGALGTTLPITAKPDHLLSRVDILSNVYREYYEGTKFDMSAGLAAGPFGNPVRFKPGKGEQDVAGTCGTAGDGGAPCSRWERPIASFRSTLIMLSQIRPHLAVSSGRTVVWFMPGAALAGVFMPVFVSAAAVPHAIGSYDMSRMDRSKAFWAFRELGQFAYPRWNNVKHEIKAARDELESRAQVMVDAVTKQFAAAQPNAKQAAAANATENVDATISSWLGLYETLVVRYSDGWDYGAGHSGDAATGKLNADRVGYPAWWLKQVGYTDGPKACPTPCP